MVGLYLGVRGGVGPIDWLNRVRVGLISWLIGSGSGLV